MQIIDNYNETPYGIVVKTKSSEIARSMYYEFNKKYNLVMQWPDLPIEIKSYLNHKQIVELNNKILFFFIDDRINNTIWIKELKRNSVEL